MDRAASSVLGVLLMTGLAVAVAGTAGLTVLDLTPAVAPTAPVELTASVAVGADTVRLSLAHGGGPSLDVRTLRLRITVADEPLPHQPPVPFYSAPGYGSFPSGPFNPSADPTWSMGEDAGLVLTGENAERVRTGTTVQVTVYRDEAPIARVEAVGG